MSYHLSRRQFAAGLAASGAVVSGLLPGCGAATLDEIEKLISAIPELSDIELGEGHYVCDAIGDRYAILSAEHAVAGLDASGAEVWRYGEVGEGPAHLSYPVNVAPAPDGTLYVVDVGNQRLVHLDANGNRLKMVGGGEEGDSPFAGVRDAVVAPDGRLFAVDSLHHVVHVYEPDGTPVLVFGEGGHHSEGDHHLNAPRGIDLDRDGRVHVVDGGNGRVQVFEPDGQWIRSYGGQGEDEDGSHFFPRSISIGPAGTAFVSDPGYGVIQVYDEAGAHIARFGELKLGNFFAAPMDVTFDNTGRLYGRVHTWTV